MNDQTRSNDLWVDPQQNQANGNPLPDPAPEMYREGVNPFQWSPAMQQQQMAAPQAFPLPQTAAQAPFAGNFVPQSTSNINAFGQGGAPSGMVGSYGGTPELPGLTAINVMNQPTAVNLESLQYLNGFLLTQIGRQVTVDFLVGSNILEDKTGTLIGVGANYILINEFATNDVVACDFYSIKFIKFYY